MQYTYGWKKKNDNFSQPFIINLAARSQNCKAPVKRSQHFTEHIVTLLGATCCVRLASLLRHVATCWVLLAQI